MTTRTYLELKERCERQMTLEVCNGCSDCWLRCAEGVQTTLAEWETLQEFICVMTPDARAALEHVLAQSKTVDLGDSVVVTMCGYFDMETRRCAVYPARPLVCRLLGHVEWMPCPIEKVPRVIQTPDALALMRAYAESERRTFANWRTAALRMESK